MRYKGKVMAFLLVAGIAGGILAQTALLDASYEITKGWISKADSVFTPSWNGLGKKSDSGKDEPGGDCGH